MSISASLEIIMRQCFIAFWHKVLPKRMQSVQINQVRTLVLSIIPMIPGSMNAFVCSVLFSCAFFVFFSFCFNSPVLFMASPQPGTLLSWKISQSD